MGSDSAERSASERSNSRSNRGTQKARPAKSRIQKDRTESRETGDVVAQASRCTSTPSVAANNVPAEADLAAGRGAAEIEPVREPLRLPSHAQDVTTAHASQGGHRPDSDGESGSSHVESNADSQETELAINVDIGDVSSPNPDSPVSPAVSSVSVEKKNNPFGNQGGELRRSLR